MKDRIYNILGQEIHGPTNYCVAGVSPDIAMSMLRKDPLAPRDLDAEFALQFGTSAAIQTKTEQSEIERLHERAEYEADCRSDR